MAAVLEGEVDPEKAGTGDFIVAVAADGDGFPVEAPLGIHGFRKVIDPEWNLCADCKAAVFVPFRAVKIYERQGTGAEGLGRKGEVLVGVAADSAVFEVDLGPVGRLGSEAFKQGGLFAWSIGAYTDDCRLG